VAKDIYRLSQLLRYVTYEAGNEFMPLSKEIKFIEDYLFAPKRFEDTLFLEYTVEGIVGEQRGPSLVFIHLSKIFSNMA
jgi:LytS/YehU family sensor histidine kinase